MVCGYSERYSRWNLLPSGWLPRCLRLYSCTLSKINIAVVLQRKNELLSWPRAVGRSYREFFRSNSHQPRVKRVLSTAIANATDPWIQDANAVSSSHCVRLSTADRYVRDFCRAILTAACRFFRHANRLRSPSSPLLPPSSGACHGEPLFATSNKYLFRIKNYSKFYPKIIRNFYFHIYFYLFEIFIFIFNILFE